ncbi:hypothetical protein ACI784_03390 [Geodermatophilus sp. SYSU D01186]
MTTADARLSLRPPAWARLYLLGFPVVFVAVVVLVIRPPLPLVVLFCAAAVGTSWRQATLRVLGTADGRLVVRNTWRTRTLHRDEITGVGVARVSGRAGNRAVELDLRDGSALRLDVTAAPALPALRTRMARQVAEIEEWRSGRPRPFL